MLLSSYPNTITSVAKPVAVQVQVVIAPVFRDVNLQTVGRTVSGQLKIQIDVLARLFTKLEMDRRVLDVPYDGGTNPESRCNTQVLLRRVMQLTYEYGFSPPGEQRCAASLFRRRKHVLLGSYDASERI
jgi:hypothetical protein